MMKSFGFVMLCCSLLVSGCLTQPMAPKKDAFSGLAGTLDPAYPNTTLGLIITENTKASIEYLGQKVPRMILGVKMGMDKELGKPKGKHSGVEPETFRDDAIMELKKNFKNVVLIEHPSQARNVAADLVGVLDVYVKTTPYMGNIKDWRIEVSAIFTDLGGREVAQAKAATAIRQHTDKEFRTMPAEIRELFQKELRSQSGLGDFVRNAGAEPAQAAAARTAPAARIYSSDVDLPDYSNSENANGFALVIGIEEYESLPKADFAERDARAVREHLKGLGYPDRNILFLTGRKAGKAAFEKYIESWLPMNVNEDSKVFVYFSGHGAPDIKTGSAYLVPWDGDAKFIEQTGYSVKKLYAKLNALKAREVIVTLDACFSGTGGRSVLAKGTRPLVNTVDVGMDTASRLMILSASKAEEITGTEESQGHGLFTYHLLKGLNESKGRSSVKQLHNYLLPRVQDSARRENRDQTPQVYPADLKDEARLRMP